MGSGFEGVVGQEGAIQALQRSIVQGGGSGATLIVGPEGVGRFLLALRAAGIVLAPDGGAASARVDSLQHADLIVLERGAGIDGMREAIKLLSRRPVEADRQVLVVRDADRLSGEAHNALLKTLEEPPADACVLVIAQGVEFLPETVVSRCRLVRARPLDLQQTRRLLESQGLDPALADDAEGSPGRAAYLAENRVPEAVERVLALLARRVPDPVAEAEKVVRRRSEESSKEQRERLGETLRVVALRLRRELPDSETDLRCVLEALGSLAGNANPAIVFAELAIHPWRSRRPPRPS